MTHQPRIWRPVNGHTERTDGRDSLLYNVDEASEQFPGLEPLTSVSFHTYAPGRNPEPLTLRRNVESLEMILRGTAEYQNSFGVHATYPQGTAHILSAGIGASQTLVNASDNEELQTLRLDFLPRVLNTKPYHATAAVPFDLHTNALIAVAEPASPGNALPLRQRATLLAGTFDAEFSFGYTVNDGIALAVVVVEGAVRLQEHQLQRRDVLAVLGESTLSFVVERKSVLALVEVAVTAVEETHNVSIRKQLPVN